MKHRKPRPITALQRWMIENRCSDAALAEGLNAILEREGKKLVSARSVAKWRTGEDGTVPRPATQLAIIEFTNGAVTSGDLIAVAS